MVQPLIPSLTDRRRELCEQLVPADEVDAVYDQYAVLMRAYLASLPVELTAASVTNPPEPVKLDALVKTALVALAKARVRGGLKKLCWVASTVFDPDFALDWTDPKHLLAALVHTRVHQTDFYLSEYRDLQAHEDDSKAGADWYVQHRAPSGTGVLRKVREFPMWGVEHLHHLDNYQKATAWYRENLMARGIVSA